ncbi:ABC-F family ATP-binding cassette domain-containing protein [Melissococcus plutonius]|uniref:ATPase components of ABC transporters with duplicated ATPase domains n=1 Tax=Melissococcus plutonius TaxID=33970 RepID=A0A2Z5Y2F3_9ENTE|nr:ABC-F family ATP-binding cassette domain-containing protein [Melissococcus plutonius]BAL62109.1 ABC transporter ATPase [Melissococcus plutonius DAT561]MCV2497874.1 ABC-F family ATP-binding cassette domain-containing protein [Melissococcus plutonius]MCV2500519.1 ABC-F family ATP-binding cassette domain-containing protein [Melissococcus plutonius]MCV2505213.1 ABC-F family ATP-binding cassette domain-containing protein [Melissococcus plutonius]MCV2506489.1 ABC-F family ATP-binding cassette dom
MKELQVTNLTKSYGEKILFDHLSFNIHSKDRIGLIGTNGTGKTSLLNILAKKDKGEGDLSSIQHPNDYTIGYLSQEPPFSPNLTVIQTVFQGDSLLLQTVRDYELALLALEQLGMNEKTQKQYAQAEEKMNKYDAWSADTTAKIILQKLGIDYLQKKMSDLSGGQQKRVGLAQILIESPDLLLLDEPTNHLDYETIEWLENFLASYKGAFLVVTHDRYFLDHVTNRIFELSFGKLYEYKGNYENYLLDHAQREDTAIQQEAKRKQLYKKELDWIRAGVKARGTKQQARIDRFEDLKKNLHQVKQKQALEVGIDTQRLGKKVIEIKNGDYQKDKHTILNEFNLLVQAGDRIGITGKNGTGKTTLLNILSGRLPLEAGSYTVGQTVHLAYYTQQSENLDPTKRMIAYLQETANEVKMQNGTLLSAAELLERFLFPRFMHGTLIGKLSGGEKRRLYLLKLLISQPNVLLLDEPTNDLDIDTLTVLEDYIQNFSGVVISVSHDRYFLNKTADRLLIFQGNGKIDEFLGSIDEYLDQEKQSEKKETLVKKTAKKKNQPKEKTKLTYMEQKEWVGIEEEITQLEKKVISLTEEMTQQGDNFVRLEELQQELTTIEQQLDEKMARWEYLSAFVDN